MSKDKTPLGFDDATADTMVTPDGKNGSERARRNAAMLIGGFVIRTDEEGKPVTKQTLSLDESEYIVRQMEKSAENGTIMDPFVLLTGVTQTPRYVNGVDLSAALAEKIAVTAYQSPGKKEIKVCARADNQCTIDKPISRLETGAVLSPEYPITPEMNDRRWLAAGTGLAAEATYATTIRDPKKYAFGDYTPAEFLELKRKQARLGTIDELVGGTRVLLRECLIGTNPALDVKKCATIASNAAAFYVAEHPGFQFDERQPANLGPLPRVNATRGSARTPGN